MHGNKCTDQCRFWHQKLQVSVGVNFDAQRELEKLQIYSQGGGADVPALDELIACPLLEAAAAVPVTSRRILSTDNRSERGGWLVLACPRVHLCLRTEVVQKRLLHADVSCAYQGCVA